MSIDRPNPATSSAADEPNRPSRLPRWTRQEILVLIQGKKVTEGLRGPARGPGPPAEPKWATVSAYCRRHGVDRGPVQCRKRWSNLAGDFKKIREWESRNSRSFWSMRNDARRESGLPGFFDREVYDILDDGAAAVAAPPIEGVAADDGLVFSDSEGAETMWEKGQPSCAGEATPGTTTERHSTENPLKASTSKEGQEAEKRMPISPPDKAVVDHDLQNKLLEVFEQNSRLLTAQLEAQNINCRLDREQRKEQVDGLLGVLNKFADAISRIADKF
ncbi:hypothetical protein QJS10_CPA16g00824 [Acorus calamus]|uniref:Myb-like domain-containing protein n=1 Tax=Acorus calamus TaxID=4465 RepID=A0AAV9CZG3_ACOCL|nr:hypothetical protein QJS10_CPA16g00824 [Acorus calamus]